MMNRIKIVRELINLTSKFKNDAHSILGVHETSPSRIINLDKTYKELKALSINQDELLRQSLRCVENELYRAAHVMAWAGLMDFVEELIDKKGFSELKKVRSKWNVSNLQDLRENIPESQIIDAAKDLRLYSKSISKALHGLLNKRNECAHPSDYYPNLNETLGYISEIINRIAIMAGNLSQ
jgi:hypothetical protein